MSGPYRTTACRPSRAVFDTITAAPQSSSATRIMSSVSMWSSTTSTRSPERSTLRRALRREWALAQKDHASNSRTQPQNPVAKFLPTQPSGDGAAARAASRRPQPMVRELVEERAIADAQDPGGVQAIPAGALEGGEQHGALGFACGLSRDLLEPAHLGVGGAAGHGTVERDARPRAGPELVGDVIVAAEHGDSPHHVLELPHVARPVVAAEELEGRRAHGRRLAVLGHEATLEVLDERGNVLRPLAQGRDTDLDDVQSVVEVLAELARLDR